MPRTVEPKAALISAATLAAVLVATLLAISTAHAQTLQPLHLFAGAPDGAYPYAGLIRDATGNLYGTTQTGGATCYQSITCGTVFKIDSAGAETVLYRFKGGADGAWPVASLIIDSAGNLYGTTSAGGGTGCSDNGFGCGTVFKLSPNGQETVLYRLQGGEDGGAPWGNLIRDPAGNLYGATTIGGGTGCNGSGCGTVFRVDSRAKETVLYRFTGTTDAAFPAVGLIRDAAGNLYGTTAAGGGGNCSDGNFGDGCGTVFKLTRNSDGKWMETLVHVFSGSDGNHPLGSLLRDRAGNLYGTTRDGGTSTAPSGVLFEVKPSGKESTLFNFPGYLGYGGGNPYGNVVMDSAHNLYGTTSGGGNQYAGVIFKFDLNSSKETQLYSYPESCGRKGCSPQAGLVRDPAGNLYGTTPYGGDRKCPNSNGGCGLVFKLTK
jgi:uncharacterized repeat protein (TIGR03803 family)